MGGLGWSEILIILVVALIIFGPRKLPELGKTLGNSLAQFRRASEDFKRTWEDEVETERRRVESHTPDFNSSASNDTVAYNSDPTPPGQPEDQYQLTEASAEISETTNESYLDAAGGEAAASQPMSSDILKDDATTMAEGVLPTEAVAASSDTGEQSHNA